MWKVIYDIPQPSLPSKKGRTRASKREQEECYPLGNRDRCDDLYPFKTLVWDTLNELSDLVPCPTAKPSHCFIMSTSNVADMIKYIATVKLVPPKSDRNGAEVIANAFIGAGAILLFPVMSSIVRLNIKLNHSIVGFPALRATGTFVQY